MSNSETKVTLISCDDKKFEIDRKVAMSSQQLAEMIEADCVGGLIPVPNVTGRILAKVIEYCEKHADDVDKSNNDKEADDESVVDESNTDKKTDAEPTADESDTGKEADADAEPAVDESETGKEANAKPVVVDPLKTWDEEFVKVDMDTLYDLLLAANYLNIAGLLNLLVQTVANMIKGKSVEVLREMFNITNDFTPEEEEEIRKENQWVFE